MANFTQNSNENLSLEEKRQKRLFNYLKKRGNHFTLQQTIADALPKFYPYDNRYNFHDSRARMIMTKDIQKINDSSEYEKIIISSAQGIKLSTKREFEGYINSQFASVFAKLKRVRRKAEKGHMDGQAIMGVSLEDVDHIISAFIEEDE